MTVPSPAQDTPAARLIAITGIDGAGKSTLAARLHHDLNAAGHTAILVGKHTTDVPDDPDLSAYIYAVNAAVYRRSADVARLCGDRYWLLALAAWYSLQDKLVIQPALNDGVTVILDNTHHKILARYAVNPDIPAGLPEQVFAHLTEPDMVLFLRISGTEALRRKGEFTSLETGHAGSADADFIAYQDLVLDQLNALADRDRWHSLDVADMDRAKVLAEAGGAVHDRLGLNLA